MYSYICMFTCVCISTIAAYHAACAGPLIESVVIPEEQQAVRHLNRDLFRATA